MSRAREEELRFWVDEAGTHRDSRISYVSRWWEVDSEHPDPWVRVFRVQYFFPPRSSFGDWMHFVKRQVVT